MTALASHSLAARGLRPIHELGAKRPHGSRLRYMAGCRCVDCRRANCSYEKTRAAARKNGDWNGLVAAEKARDHIARLSAAGVGRRAIGDASGIAYSILIAISSGEKRKIRARTEKAILAVTTAAAADHALIPAGPTWRLLDDLIADGHSKASLARQLGKGKALQLSRDQVTVRNAYEVERLHARLQSVEARPTLRLLEELVMEGYMRANILARLSELAAYRGLESPTLGIVNGRIRATEAALVAVLHAQLME